MDISKQTSGYDEYKLLVSHVTDSPDIHVTLSQFMNPLYQACENSEPAYSLSEEQLSEQLTKAWDSIILLASQSAHDSHDQEQLVKIMKKLVSQVPLEGPDKKVVEVEGGRVWTDLPLFGQRVRGSWNFPAHEEADQQIKEKWININAFIARLTVASWEGAAVKAKEGEEYNSAALDFSLYGVWALRSAFEEDVKKSSTGDAIIGAAAVWVLYANAALKDLSEKQKEFHGKVAKPGSKLKEKEWRGYNPERWEHWTTELSQAADLVQDERIQKLAAKAWKALKE